MLHENLLSTFAHKVRQCLRKGLSADYLSLHLINLCAYFFPFLANVIVARSLESSEYGQYYSVINLLNILAVVVDWGFSLYTLNLLCDLVDKSNKVNELFSGIVTSKCIIFLIVLPVITFSSFGTFQLSLIELLFASLVLLSYIFNPSYLYFSYRESSTYLIRTIYVRLAYLVILSVCAYADKVNLFIVLSIYALYSISFSVYPFFLLIHEKNLKYKFDLFDSMRLMLKTLRLFVGNVFVVFYTTFVIYKLPSSVGLEATGFFGVAYTLVKALQNLQTPITQIILFGGHKIKAKVVYFQIVALFFLMLFCWFFGDLLIKTIFGARFQISENVVKCLSLIILIGGCSNIFINQIFIKGNNQSKILFILFVGGFFSLVSSNFFLHEYGVFGGALVMVISEALILISSILLSMLYLSNTRDYK